MSEKDNKKNKKATEAAESAAKEAAPEAAESAAEAAETTEDTYTVTRAQMEQMEALAKTRWRTPMTNICGWRRSTTTTGSGPRARRSTCTMTRRSTPSSRFWRCWTTWNGA